MFNVIRIPTKFSKTIKRMSNEERLQVFDLLIRIGDGGEISPPDNIVGDVVQLIYGEWMNMESKSKGKPEKSNINLCSEGPGEVCPSDPGTRVEYSRVEDNRIEESTHPENTEDKKIQDTKYNKDEWDDYLSNEGFGTLIAKSLMEIGWKPKENTASFQKWVDKTLDANKITRSEKDYDKLKSGLIGFVEHFKVNKSKVPKASLSSNFCLRFNLK